MRGQCDIESCNLAGETRKIHEDFEWFKANICWECGDQLIEIIGANNMEIIKSTLEIMWKRLT